MYNSPPPTLGTFLGVPQQRALKTRLRGAYFDLRHERRRLRLEIEAVLPLMERGASISDLLAPRIRAYETARVAWREAYLVVVVCFGLGVARELFNDIRAGTDESEGDVEPSET